jgi:hypothetical protein
VTAEHLTVRQAGFGGERFWARLNELADGCGHAGHTRWLTGQAEWIMPTTL